MADPVVKLAPLSDANREEVAALAVHEHQRQYLSTPDLAGFLADAHEHPEFTPLAVVSGEEVVGFVSVGTLLEAGHWWVPLFIIDRGRQRRGFGRAALMAVVEHVRQRDPTAFTLGLGCDPANTAAMDLYRRFGFEECGFDASGEAQLWLTLE